MTQYSGVFTPQQQGQALTSGQWATDPYYKNTTLLLHADDAANGSQNNTFLDSSSNNFSVTRNGSLTQGTFTPYGGNWSNYFDGSSNIVGSLSSALGTGDFTVEFWVYIVSNTGISGEGGFFQTTTSSTGLSTSEYGSTSLTMQRNGTTNKYGFSLGATSVEFSNAGTYLNQWMHVACVRSSGTARIYLNGVLNSTPTSATTNLTGTYIGIGGYYNTNYLINAYISNFRVTNTVVYSANFTPPTTPLTAITGTLFLGCQSNRFLNTNSGAAMTVNTGTPSVQRFSPFAPQYQYVPTVSGCSGGYGGNSNSGWTYTANDSAFQIAANQAFTVEAWVYPKQLTDTGDVGLYGSYIAAYENDWGWELKVDGGVVRVTSVGWYYPAFPGTLQVNAWNHIAMTRATDGTLTCYLNGVAGTPVAGSTGAITPYIQQYSSPTALQTGINVANWTTPGNLRYFNGYIADFRYVVGSAIVPPVGGPTAPLTPVAGTAYMLQYNNAGIVDSTMMDDLVTVGNAQVSTNVAKYGSGSMYFDGNGDYLTVSPNEATNFGTGDFTVEFWVNGVASGTYVQTVGKQYNAADNGAWRVGTRYASANQVYFARGNGSTFDELIAAANVNDGAWHHVAVTRLNGAVCIYVDGTARATSVISGTCSVANSLYVGYNYRDGQYFAGYLDDIRITKGVARYTGNFIPPKVAMPNQ